MVFADAPGGSQVPDTVIEAVSQRYRDGISNMDGAFVVSEETEELAAAARRAGADLVGAEPNQIVFGANSTSLLLHLSRSFARTIGPGDTVVVTRLDHDANVRPWVLAARDAGATVRWVDLHPEDATLDLDSFDAALADRPAPGGVHARVQRRGHRDAGRRSGGACEVGRRPRRGRRRPFRAAPFDRLPGPGRRHGDRLAVQGVRTTPGHGGGEAARSSTRGTPTASGPPITTPPPNAGRPAPRTTRGSPGSSPPSTTWRALGRDTGAAGETARADQVTAAFGAIGEHERTLAARFLEGLASIAPARLYGIPGTDRLAERTSTFAVRLGDQHPRDTSKALAERGIFTWDGHYYAMELFERLDILETGGAVRIGFCHYHTPDEVDRVLEALDDLA